MWCHEPVDKGGEIRDCVPDEWPNVNLRLMLVCVNKAYPLVLPLYLERLDTMASSEEGAAS